jgi:hypothetical protein
MTAPEPLKKLLADMRTGMVFGGCGMKHYLAPWADLIEEAWNRRAEAPALTEEEREALEIAVIELGHAQFDMSGEGEHRVQQSSIIIRAMLARTDPNRKEGGA